MGATTSETFWRVVFPRCMPGVAAAGLLVFIGSLGFYITPALLGGPRETMLGQLIIQQIMVQQNWAFAGALSTMLGASTLLACLVYDFVFGLSGLGGGAAGGQVAPLDQGRRDAAAGVVEPADRGAGQADRRARRSAGC